MNVVGLGSVYTFYSTLQVILQREFTFRNSKHHYEGIPIIASNMDTVGTFEMAKTLAKVCTGDLANIGCVVVL